MHYTVGARLSGQSALFACVSILDPGHVTVSVEGCQSAMLIGFLAEFPETCEPLVQCVVCRIKTVTYYVKSKQGGEVPAARDSDLYRESRCYCTSHGRMCILNVSALKVLANTFTGMDIKGISG